MTRLWLKLHFFAVALYFMVFAMPTLAHNISTAYLKADARGSSISGSLRLDVLDVNRLLPLDLNGDGQITWGEAKSGREQFGTEILRQIYFTQLALPACHPKLGDVTAELLNASYYLVVNWSAECDFEPNAPVKVWYDMLFDLDRSHVAIASFNGGDPVLFNAGQRVRELTIKPLGLAEQFMSFLREGVWHIFIGYDHILFILTLVMAVFHMASGRIFVELLKVVTAFTVAHSITLFLVGTGLLSLPTRLVESTIALSIVIGAVNNLYRFLPGTTVGLAFVFGLIHGFGFASVFQELSPSASGLVIAVLSFNIGVEVGQLVIVACAVPLFSALRKAGFFDVWIYKYGSVAVSLIALVWLFERVTSIAIF